MTTRPYIIIVSSAPPTPCGLATFTAALRRALVHHGARVGILRVTGDNDEAVTSEDELHTIGTLRGSSSEMMSHLRRQLDEADLVLVQHEYGLYGGHDGEDVLTLMRGVRTPMVAILHTVLPRPTPHQATVLNEVMRLADRVVVMTQAARATVSEVFDSHGTDVVVIPHGGEVLVTPSASRRYSRPFLLTWGLLGPGKGIEWVIDALADLRDLQPAPLYVVAGRTHPKVLEREGERYRRSLERRVIQRGVSEMVVFDDAYRSLGSLHQLIDRADLVVLPYDSTDQATSGVLVDAIAAGKPVVATAFPHAVELLTPSAGLVVRHRSPRALSDALRRALSEPELLAAMTRGAREQAPDLSWDRVAGAYMDVAHELAAQSSAVGA